jgi:hypothetical protein
MGFLLTLIPQVQKTPRFGACSGLRRGARKHLPEERIKRFEESDIDVIEERLEGSSVDNLDADARSRPAQRRQAAVRNKLEGVARSSKQVETAQRTPSAAQSRYLR